MKLLIFLDTQSFIFEFNYKFNSLVLVKLFTVYFIPNSTSWEAKRPIIGAEGNSLIASFSTLSKYTKSCISVHSTGLLCPSTSITSLYTLSFQKKNTVLFFTKSFCTSLLTCTSGNIPSRRKVRVTIVPVVWVP